MIENSSRFFGVTTDATPLNLTGIGVPPNSQMDSVIIITGSDLVDSISIRVISSFVRYGEAAIIELGANGGDRTVKTTGAGASSWTGAVQENGIDLLVQVKGEVGKTIYWGISGQLDSLLLT